MSTLIEIRHLSKDFTARGRFGRVDAVRAVNDVSFAVEKGKTFGLVGESGCGKTTLGRTVTRLYEPTEGEILFEGVDIARLSGKPLSPYKRRMQTIFQDPYSSLNPYMNVEDLIGEPLDLAERLSRDQRRERILDMLRKVGMEKDDLEKYPHEFSGGQRQRIGIARALVTRPDFVLCDEPISALDVSIQAQVVNLLEDLQQEMGLTYIFVAHDLSMVRHISQRIAVMYLGHIVEISPADELYRQPLHPYTQALLSAIPIPNPRIAREQRRIHLAGDPPNPSAGISGCPFASRCPHCTDACRAVRPTLREITPGHQVACFRVAPA
ncbi:MAG: ABC transporter ATP-binding protein [Clostridia bacterium]|nr:ABC transporter ATP-binding protein [Clostridia bacterium]